MGLEGFNGVLFDGFYFRVPLTVVEIDEIGGSVVLTSLLAFRAVSGEVPDFSALETGVRLVSRSGRVALEVVLRAVPLVVVGILSSAEVVTPVVSSIVSSRRCPVPVYVHGDRGVVHPTRGV